MQISAKLRKVICSVPDQGFGLAYWCQGCESAHIVWTKRPTRPCWTWDGNKEKPTFTPSVLVTMTSDDPEIPSERCHTFIRAGMVEFLTDCTHKYAGQTLPLPDWPYEDGTYGGVEPLPE